MLTQTQYLLGELAKRIEQNIATEEDFQYLARCLKLISEGMDARDVFKTRRRKGTTPERLKATINKNVAITQIVALVRPAYQSEQDFSVLIPSGGGLTEEEAISLISEHYEVEFETMERYWNKYKRECKDMAKDPLTPFFQFGDLYQK
jgi:hypothetical protein